MDRVRNEVVRRLDRKFKCVSLDVQKICIKEWWCEQFPMERKHRT